MFIGPDLCSIEGRCVQPELLQHADFCMIFGRGQSVASSKVVDPHAKGVEPVSNNGKCQPSQNYKAL